MKKSRLIKTVFTAAFLLAAFTFPNVSFSQTNWYYKGTGALNDLTSWGSAADGTGSNPPDFSSANSQYILQNATSITHSGTWTVSGTASKVIMGNPTTPAAAITLTLNAAAVITVPSSSFDVSVPVSGAQKIIYKNSSALSLGAVNDASLELVFDGATITTSSAKTFGNVSLINNATVDMGAASAVMKNLTIDAGSVLSGPIGSSSQYIAIKTVGAVTINGTFKAGRQGGFYTTGVAIPVTTSSSYGSILFQDASANLTLGLSSTIEYNRGTSGQTGAQPVAALTYANLVLSNSAVASNKTFAAGVINVSGTMTINLTGAATITAPTQNINLLPGAKLLIISATAFPTGDKLVLQSNASGTASIGTITAGASVTGNVTVQQYIAAGSRRFRFLSHPFTTAQALSQLTDNIDITGNTAGTTGQAGQTTGTGFTATPSNNPAAFFFNTSNANGGATDDAGWTAFTDATTASWQKAQGIRVLIRGTKSQSGTLDGTNASPAAVTLDMAGPINTGAVAVNLVTGGTGATAGYNLVGNPYPSPVDIGAVLTAATNIGTSFYLRNPQTGSYITVNPIPANYVIPANTAFVIKANAATTLNFAEANKASCTSCPTVFKPSAIKNRLQLKLLKDGVEYDNVFLNIDPSFSNGFDNADAAKLMNDVASLYFLSDDNIKLAADYTSSNNAVKMGIAIQPSAGQATYSLSVAEFIAGNGMKIMLHDKLTGVYTLLKSKSTYVFSVDGAVKNSFGNDRFEITFSK